MRLHHLFENRKPLNEGKTVAVKFYDEFDTGYVVHIGDNTLSINGNEVDTNYQWDRKKGHAFSGAEPYVSEWMYKMAKSWGDVHAWLKRVRDTGDEKSILAAVQKAFKTGSMKPKIVENIEELTEEQFDEAAGEKDACYHKVKSRYKVWPSAYASGALVKCRKVGAKNWGNGSKK